MKKTIWVVLLSMAFALVGCKYDDSELQDKVKGIDERVTALEQRVADLNTNASGIQGAISALQSQLYVSKVVVNRDENGNPVTYDITFSDGTTITLVKGLKGDQGPQGEQGDQGEVGPMPELGVELIDGLYYWTVEGELLKETRFRSWARRANGAIRRSSRSIRVPGGCPTTTKRPGSAWAWCPIRRLL